MKKFLNLHSLIILIILLIILYNVIDVFQFQRGQRPAEVAISPFTGAVDYEGYTYAVKEERGLNQNAKLTPHAYESRIHERYKYASLIDKYVNQKNNLLDGSILESLDVSNVYDTADAIYLNVSARSFDDRYLNENNIYVYIMSIVNSLTEFSRHQSVHFLVNGDIQNPRVSPSFFTEAFHRDERLIDLNDEYLISLLKHLEQTFENGDIEGAKEFFTFDLGAVEDERFVNEVSEIFERYPLDQIASSSFSLAEGYRRLNTTFIKDGEQEDFTWNFRFKNNLLTLDYYNTIVNNLE